MTTNANTEKGGILLSLARILSFVMHPFLLPIYAVVLLIFSGGFISFAPARLKMFFVLLVALNTLIIPALSITILRTTGVLADLSLDTRQQRTIPLAIVAICYGICIYMISDIMFGFMLRKYFIVAFSCAVMALIINYFWKISLHMIGAGAITGIMVIFAISGLGSVFLPLVVMILASGLLASARLLMGKHTPTQVAAGFLVGMLCSSALLFL